MPKKVRVSGSMRVRTREVLRRAIEEGIQSGWNRAHKHSDSPGKDGITEQIEHYIMLSIDEMFTFDDDMPE